MKVQSVDFVKGVVGWDGFPRDGLPEVALWGRSNVGKSSLLNLIVGRRAMARVSRTPGRTRELNYFRVNDAFYLVDLPGYGYARVSRKQRASWNRLIERYLHERPELRLLIHLIDSRHPPMDSDQDALILAADAPLSYAIALTKCDKPKQRDLAHNEEEVRRMLAHYGMEAPVIRTSAEKRRGAKELLSVIESALSGPPPTWPRESGTEGASETASESWSEPGSQRGSQPESEAEPEG